MNFERCDFDAVVVGAGSAGSAAALGLARVGLRVALVEKRRLGEAGASWVNGIVPWMFDRAGLGRPCEPEKLGGGGPTTLLGRTERARVTLAASSVLSVDMRLLVRRLQSLAVEAGVHAYDRARIADLGLEHGRPVRLRVERRGARGRTRAIDLRARLFVDASGLEGALRRRVPDLDRDCPSLAGRHTCTAAQEVCEIRDPGGARAFLARNRARQGDTLFWPGVDGGFSALQVRVEKDLDIVDLLAGTIAVPGRSTGPRLLGAFKARERWVGKRVLGGAGLVPLRRPYDRLAAEGIALVGDAACQVFPAHGSGTGAGLVAARLLAEVVAAAEGRGDPGAQEVLWAYQAAFQREVGAILAAYDVLRRFSQSLSLEDVEAMLEVGLISEATIRSGVEATMPSRNPADLIAAARAALRRPRLAARFVPSLARMTAVHQLYLRYPNRPSRPRLKLWSRAVAALFGEPADVA